MGRQWMTGMDDVERRAVHGDPEILAKKNKTKSTWCFWGIVVAVALCTVTLIALLHKDAHYYVAIDSVSSGLDPMRCLSFNLTLGVYSWSYGAKACIKPGMFVDVSYGGVKLAASDAEAGRLCIGPRKSAEQHVTARGAGVSAGQMLDRLTTDLKQGVAVFDVSLHLPAELYGRSLEYDGKSCMTKCGGRRVGAATAWCDAPDQMPALGAVA